MKSISIALTLIALILTACGGGPLIAAPTPFPAAVVLPPEALETARAGLVTATSTPVQLIPTQLPLPSDTAAPSEMPTLEPSATRDPNLVPTLPPLEAGLVTHGRRDVKRVALTFDACEMPGYPAGYDDQIISILTETHTKATLFLGGLWMENHPEQARALGSNPLFEIGSHSYSHPDFAAITSSNMSAEIEHTQGVAWRLAGRLPVLFRLPGGTYTDEALNVIAEHGLRTIQWEVVTGDPDPNIQATDMLREIKLKTQNGSIIIMHMNGRGWHTAEALPDIIDWLKSEGYELVTVSELL